MATERIRILLIVAGLDIGGRHGGAERFGADLARCLPRDRFEVTLCAFWRTNTEAETSWLRYLEQSGLTVVGLTPFGGHTRALAFMGGVRRLLAAAHAESFDIVHSHFQLGSLAALALKLTGRARRIVRTAHVSREWGTGMVGFVARSVFTDWVFPLHFDAQVAVSSHGLRQLWGHPGTRAVRRTPVLIHNAIDVKSIRARAASNPRGPHAAPRIGSVGRLTHQKGYEYLVEAIPDILRQSPQAKFEIVGEGDRQPQLEATARQLGVSHALHLLQPRRDIVPFLRGLDIFVLPSLWEGYPSVVLECMACNVPVVATDIPGTREIVLHGQNGWLVPPRDTHALRIALLHLLENPDVRDALTHAAQQQLDSFDLQHAVARHKELYDRLLAARP